MFKFAAESVLSSEDIKKLIRQISREINMKYNESGKVTIVPILDAAFMFASDLAKNLKSISTEFKFVKVESYNNGIPSKPIIRTNIMQSDVMDKDVLIVDTIIDSGSTVRLVTKKIMELSPKTLNVCALVVKKNDNNKDIKVNFSHKSGVEGFLFGYGTDLDDGSCRNLEFILSKKG